MDNRPFGKGTLNLNQLEDRVTPSHLVMDSIIVIVPPPPPPADGGGIITPPPLPGSL